MRKILFILAINFLIHHGGGVHYMISRPVNAFLSVFRAGSSEEYEESSTESDADADEDPNLDSDSQEEEDSEIAGKYEPLQLTLVSFDGKTTMGLIGNPMFIRHDIRAREFVDAIYACPSKKSNTLVIKRSYTFFKNKYVAEANLSAETSENNANDAQHGENGEVGTSNSNQEQHPNKNISNPEQVEKDEPEFTSMERQKENFVAFSSPSDGNFNLKGLLSAFKKKIKRKDSLEHISEEHGAVPEKNRVDSLDQQEKNSSGENKMGTDSAPSLKTEETDLERTKIHSVSIQKTNAAPNKTETEPASNQKPGKTVEKMIVKRSGETLTAKNEFYWIKAVDDVENFKCLKPVKPVLKLVPSDNLHKAYVAGFHVDSNKHDFEYYTKFDEELPPNQKIKFLWSLNIIFTKLDQSVCVYHEVQYNKDTYNPQINDDFDDHDFGNSVLFPDLDIIQLYKIENQEEVFGKLFENENERKTYFNAEGGRYLERLHLAPLHGFLSSAMRQSAKTYGNIAPMWNSIKTGAWGKLEEYVNTLSNVLKHLVVITGTYGILKLDGKEVYLAEDNKIPVPLAFWKMVVYQHDLNDFPGIIFVTSNNPYEDIGDVICKQDKCKEFGWEYVREDDLTRGRTVCCDFTSDILKELEVLRGTQPTKVLNLNLNELSPLVNEVWEFDEEGERTSTFKRLTILHKIKKYKKSERKIIAVDEKTGQFVEKEDTEMRDVGYDVKKEDSENDNVENKDINENKDSPIA